MRIIYFVIIILISIIGFSQERFLLTKVDSVITDSLKLEMPWNDLIIIKDCSNENSNIKFDTIYKYCKNEKESKIIKKYHNYKDFPDRFNSRNGTEITKYDSLNRKKTVIFYEESKGSISSISKTYYFYNKRDSVIKWEKFIYYNISNRYKLEYIYYCLNNFENNTKKSKIYDSDGKLICTEDSRFLKDFKLLNYTESYYHNLNANSDSLMLTSKQDSWYNYKQDTIEINDTINFVVNKDITKTIQILKHNKLFKLIQLNSIFKLHQLLNKSEREQDYFYDSEDRIVKIIEKNDNGNNIKSFVYKFIYKNNGNR